MVDRDTAALGRAAGRAGLASVAGGTEAGAQAAPAGLRPSYASADKVRGALGPIMIVGASCLPPGMWA